MVKPRTHFEQVPLEVVKKIVEEEVQRQETDEPVRETRKKKLEEDLLEASTFQGCGGKS